MEDRVTMWKGAKELAKRLRPYRYALGVLALGAALLMLPSGEETPQMQQSERTEDVWLAQVQEELSDTLSRIEGAGRVTLMLSVEQGVRSELARDTEAERRENGESLRSESVVVSEGSGQQTAVVEATLYPVFRGAVAVCEGGDKPSVRLAVTDAIAALTGLSSDKISVIKGNVK